MKEIKTVGVVGLGALGILFARHLTEGFGRENVLILADKERVSRYAQEGVYMNDQFCDFQYVDAAACTRPLDLLLVATKFGALREALSLCRHLVTPETTLVSVLNGISSEEVMGAEFTPEQVVWCVAEKMSATKTGNRLMVEPLGDLAIGVPDGMDKGHLNRLVAFFDAISFPYALPQDIRAHAWSKLICNVGINPVTMVFEGNYGTLQAQGKPRETMLAAMEEAMAVAHAEGIALGEDTIPHWVGIVDAFPPQGTTSMAQDRRAMRYSEVELFAGTICRLGHQHGIPVPTNEWLYKEVARIEAGYRA